MTRSLPRLSLFAVLTLLVAMVAAAFTTAPSEAQEEPDFDALLFTRTAEFRHDSIPAGIAAVQQMATDNNFAVDATEDPTVFTEANLANYDLVIFLSTTGDVLDPDQQAAMEGFIQDGGGYAGIHAAADTEYDWDWYGGLVGAWFDSHPANQTATIEVTDRDHPSTSHLPTEWERLDEWYNYRTNPRGDVHVLASLDEATYDAGAGTMGADHPITWCQDYDGGRSWYTGLGHTIESWSEQPFLDHVLGGLLTAAGTVDADCGGTVWSNFDKVALDTGTSNPMELDVAADGRVFYVERSGEVRVIDPAAGQTTVLATLDVFLQREDGLLGLALDPDFADNNWLYLYYSPAGTEAVQRLARFTVDGDTLDLASESVLLEIPVDREVSGHAGGSLAFDPDGNLFVATGDDTNPFESDGYAPIDERPDRHWYDAQRSAANTNDLRGKVLRITPTDDGSYTVPDGNLFAAGTADTLPEIYAMGFRNPFRIDVDDRDGTLLVADYGPDANEPDPDRGPEGRVEWNRITAPGNFGWPYCHGNAVYHDYDFADPAPDGDPLPEFDCSGPTNDSPNNTGLTTLPPVVDPDLYYGRQPDGSNEPALGTGGGPMAGPVYVYDDALQSEVKWPAYYDGTAMFYEWTNNELFEIHLDDQDRAHAVTPLLDSFDFLRPMDMTFGPDGAMYLIEWGTGFGGDNTDSGIYRIEYTGGIVRPDAVVDASPTSGPAPLEVTFSSEGSGHPDGLGLTYAWTFGDGETSTESDPKHTYTEPGSYTARLTVTATDGTSASATIAITVGNTAPEVTLDPPVDGGFFDFGDDVPYAIDVVDAEDGSTAAGTIDCADVGLQVSLGHDTHAHPDEVLSGCEGTVQTRRDSGHPESEKLFYVLEGRYTDAGGDGGASLTGRDLHVLQTKRKEAEHYDDQSGVELELTSDPTGGFQNIGFIDDGDWIMFDPVNLQGIDQVTHRVASGGNGGRIELHVDDPDGPLVSTATVEPTGGWQTWTSVTGMIDNNPGGTHKLYLVFRSDDGDSGLFNLNWTRFRGKGMSLNAAPEVIEVNASPTEGELPFTTELSADAYDPEGENLTYTWDFGDGTTATGPTVSHTYDVSGVYQPTLTVTDDSGATASGFTVVEAIPPPSPPIECDGESAPGLQEDEFDGDRLDGCTWDAVVRPDLNRFRVEAGFLKIDTTPTNLFDGSNNAPNLMLQEVGDGDWAVETKVSGDVCEQWQQGGILAYASDMTFLKLDYVGTSPPGQPCVRKIEMRHEIGDVFQPAFPEVTLPDGVTTWWLRLVKEGSTFTGYYSSDGENFQELAAIGNDQLQGADVGLYAFGQEQTTATTVSFDWFHLADGAPGDTTAPTASASLLGTFNGEFTPEEGWDTAGTAELVVAEDATTLSADLSGLEPNTTHQGHLHEGVCDEMPMGGHYQDDPDGPEQPPNELWLADDPSAPEAGFRSDDDGNASASGSASWTADSTAQAVMVHAGDLGLARGCATLDTSDGPVDVVIDASDDTGVETVEYRLDGGDWTVYDGPVTVGEVGEHVVTWRATDAAGNVSEVGEATFTIRETDELPPEVTATLDPPEPNGDPAPGYEGTYHTPVTVTVEATDDDSGVDTVEYRLDGSDWTPYTEPVTVEEEGEHTVEYRATDVAGNTSQPGSAGFEIKDDACPGSDLSETVVLRDVDSGVANVDTGDGCTIEDLVEDEADYRRTADYLRHVRQVAFQLARDGVITNDERGAILDAAGESVDD